MGIEVVWETEGGEELGRVSDPHHILATAIRTTQLPADNKCLSFIDPYGDAVFNKLQLAVLARELEAVGAATGSPGVQTHLRSVLELVRSAQDQTHTYIRFFGD